MSSDGPKYDTDAARAMFANSYQRKAEEAKLAERLHCEAAAIAWLRTSCQGCNGTGYLSEVDIGVGVMREPCECASKEEVTALAEVLKQQRAMAVDHAMDLVVGALAFEQRGLKLVRALWDWLRGAR